MLRWRKHDRFTLLGVIALLTGLTCPGEVGSALAQEADPSHELWLGAHATQDTWFAYLGGTTAPFGDLNHDGFRLRAVAGHGEYRYEGHQLRIDPDNSVRFAAVAFTDRVTFTDALLGYSVQLGPLTAKAFAGLAFVEHDVSASPGFAATLEGMAWGPKIQAEFWYDAGGPYWLALNAGYTTAYDTYSVNSRTGFRLGDGGWSIGTELNLDNRATDGVSLNGAYARGGAFLRYAWGQGEISGSAGIAMDLDDSPDLLIDRQQSPYVGISLLTKF